MKAKLQMLKTVSLIIIFMSLYACEPPITFTEPQPINTANLPKLPRQLHGNYLSLTDSSSLIISNTLIQRIYDFDYKIHPNQLDSTSKLNGDTLTNVNTNESTIIQWKSDSLIIHINSIDTLFQLNYNHIIRKYKGYYFLNTRYDNTSWTVEKMQLSKKHLTISGISKAQDIESLQEFTSNPPNANAKQEFTATKKQFKSLLKRVVLATLKLLFA
ncbi:MAG: hypothetical protein DWP98_01975 [Bacteroidetes bacterium]|nr:MAG: hypothetical protein DWP98_01975 [Bacteroidota bacterium]